MKKMISMVFAMVLAMGSMSAQTTTKNVETTPFDKIQLDVTGRVKVVDGHHYGVTVRSNDKDLAEDVMVSVKDGVLGITSRSGELLTNEDASLVITIVTPHNPEISTSYNLETLDVEEDPETINEQVPANRMNPFFGMPGRGHHFGFPHMGRDFRF